MSAEVSRQIADNIARIRDRIAAAAKRSGRTADDVTLVAVTKYVGPDEARALVAAGCHDLGESRPQELWRKAELLADQPIQWHMVGHLQRNKIRRTLPLARLIHSCDSQRLLIAIDNTSAELNCCTSVLLEVNVSGDTAKHGFAPDELESVLPQLGGLTNIEIRGLMAMASLAGGPNRARQDFQKLRQLRDRLEPNCPPTISFEELSMGMSRDYEIAIEEGATIVRIGSALFDRPTDRPVAE